MGSKAPNKQQQEERALQKMVELKEAILGSLGIQYGHVMAVLVSQGFDPDDALAVVDDAMATAREFAVETNKEIKRRIDGA